MKTGRSMRLFFLIPGSLLALILGCLGVEIIPTNPLGWSLLLFGLGYLGSGALSLWPENPVLTRQAKKGLREEAGDRSFWLILPGFIAVFFASPLEYLYWGGILRATGSVHMLGTAFLLPGIALLVWTRLTLKEQYTAHIQGMEEGRPQTGGPYRYVRHPGYSGYLLICIGLGVGLGSFLGTAAVFLILLPGLIYRMVVEEKLLAKQYGMVYHDYALKTKRLIPGIW